MFSFEAVIVWIERRNRNRYASFMDFARFDRRSYRTLEVRDGYRLWAKNYDAVVRDKLDIELLERLGTVPWSRVSEAVDLACGTGRIGAWLRNRDVSTIDGVDLTPEMLARAKEKEIYRRLELIDMTATGFESETYDLATNGLAVGHLEDVATLYEEATRLVRPGGWFVLIGYHPHFLLSGIPTHFEVETGESIAIVNYVHLMADHARAALSKGWSLVSVDERVVDESWVAEESHWEPYLGHPVSFLLAWRKTGSSPSSRPGRENRSG